MIPTREECIELINKEITKEKEELTAHIMLVEKVALFLANELIKKGETLDLTIISRAALLHDIGKDKEQEIGKPHSETGRDICKENNIDEKICIMVNEHIGKAIREIGLTSTESKILFYADKRCQVNKIVSVDERYAPWIKKHKIESEILKKELKMVKQLEKEIFAKLDFKPEDVEKLIENA